MTAFNQYWERVQGDFPSETSAYFARPLLEAAFKAGRTLGRTEDNYGGKRGKQKNAGVSAGSLVQSSRAGYSNE